MNLKIKLYASVFLMLSSTSLAFSQLSPGDLAWPHKNIEGMTNCTKCHTLGSGPNSGKCLECHLEIKQYITRKSGYHFIVTETDTQTCFKCHSDHHGRDFQLIFWPGGKDKFDHSKTGYRLLGKHAKIDCENCHQPKNFTEDPSQLNEKVDVNKTFLGLGRECLSCHQDEHRGQLSKNCLQCHAHSSWKPTEQFDHNKAKFRLTGKHQKIDCAKCHNNVPLKKPAISETGKATYVKYIGLDFNNCTSCHNDVHRAKFGRNCTECHSTSGWSQIKGNRFDHSLTRFPLIGLHQRTACAKCHVGGKTTNHLRFANCTDCHKDTHLGQFADRVDGGKCESCHNVFGFSPAKFDMAEHNKTDFPLTGAHLATPCLACHVVADRGASRERRMYDFEETSCKGCHEDIHKGQFAAKIQLAGCESCHQTSSWDETDFEHDTSRFPLFGKHKTASCEKCHKTVDQGTGMQRVLFRPIDMACEACHADIHLGQFRLGTPSKTCKECHTPDSWVDIIFDHNQDSLFRLKGAHENVSCAKCHKLETKKTVQFVRFKPMDKRCVTCHG